MKIKSVWTQQLQLGVTVTLELKLSIPRIRVPSCPFSPRTLGRVLGGVGGRVWGELYSRGAGAVSLLLCLLLTFPSALWLLWAVFLFKEFA